MSHSLQVAELGFKSRPVFYKGKHCEALLPDLHPQPELMTNSCHHFVCLLIYLLIHLSRLSISEAVRKHYLKTQKGCFEHEEASGE